MIGFSNRTNTLSLEQAGCRIPVWALRLEADGKVLRGADAQAEAVSEAPLSFRLRFAQPALDWTVTAREEAGEGRWILDSVLSNRSAAAVKLGRVWMMDAEDGVRLCEGAARPSGTVALTLQGLGTPRRIHRVDDAEGPRESRIKTQFHRGDAKRALQAGFLSFGRTDTVVAHACDAIRDIGRLEAWCDFAGWELPPGAQTPTETFTVACGEDPYAQLSSWADRAAVLMGARRWEDAPIGWVGWAWVDPFTVERYEDVILRNAEAMSRRLGGFGLRYVWLSLGNIGGTAPGNWLEWNDELFPSGHEFLVRRLREHGLSLGLWCGAFWLCPLAEGAMQRMKDAILPGPDGKPLVARAEWQFGKAGFMKKADRPCVYGLDPSHPKTLEMLRKVFTTYREWGIRYYMVDFLHAAAGRISNLPYSDHHDKSLVAGPEAYRKGLAAIREAAGDDTYLLSSTGPIVHNAGFMDAVRTGNDFGEGRALYPDSYFYPATFVINSGDFWTGPQHALLNQASNWYTHRKLYLNDSGNVLTVDKPLPLSDAQVHATIHALSGGPSMIGDDLDRIDEERLSLIKKTLPRPREVAFPVNLFSHAHPDMPRVFHRRIEKPWGRFDVVAVYNFSSRMLEESVALADLGLDAAKRYLAFEFWNCEYVGRVSGALPAAVPPHCVRVYRLTEDKGVPTVLGTDMHVLMGEMDLADCAWDPASRTLRGRAHRPAGEKGSVFLHAPETVSVTTPRGVWIAKDARDKTLILRVSLSFTGASAEEGDFRVSFAMLPGVQDLATEHDRG